MAEGEVKLQGILKTTPTEVMEQLRKLVQDLPEEAVSLPEDKWHVTLIHQSILKPYRKKLKSMQKAGELAAFLGDAPAAVIDEKRGVVMRSDEEKGRKSWVVYLKNQDAMQKYVNGLMEKLGGKPKPEDREFHISLANLTGNPSDSVR